MSDQPTSAHRLLADRYGKAPLRLQVNDKLALLFGHLFSSDEAGLAAVFPVRPATTANLARRAGMSVETAEQFLGEMAQRGVIATYPSPRGPMHALLPLIPGIFEMQMWRGADEEWTRRFVELYEDYYDRNYWRMQSPTSSSFPIQDMIKVIPVQQHIESQPGVLPSDRVSELIETYTSYGLSKCCCRTSTGLRGASCGKPLDVCMVFGHLADYVIDRGMARRVDRVEISDTAAIAEEAGLVHLTDNISSANFLCSCCSCCCEGLKVITDFELPWLVAKSHFLVSVDSSDCVGCAACVDRCPTDALEMDEEHVILESERCIGCGVCISACSVQALELVPRPSYTPPHSTLSGLGAELGLQALGVTQALKRLPGPYRWLRQVVAGQVKRSFLR